VYRDVHGLWLILAGGITWGQQAGAVRKETVRTGAAAGCPAASRAGITPSVRPEFDFDLHRVRRAARGCGSQPVRAAGAAAVCGPAAGQARCWPLEVHQYTVPLVCTVTPGRY
jgi:hypothetical protein